MIKTEEPEVDLTYKFTSPDYWLVDKMWGSPLLIALNDKLSFKSIGDRKVKLTIVKDSGKEVDPIEMDYKAEQLCATRDEIDLVFRFNGEDNLMFDQDHEDNGAPGNGGATTTGNVA